MLRVVDPTQVVAWVHPMDEGEPKTVFYFRPLSYGALKVFAASNSDGDPTKSEKSMSAMIGAVLDRVEGVPTENGATKTVRGTEEFDAYIDSLPFALVKPIFDELTSMVRPTEIEAGN